MVACLGLESGFQHSNFSGRSMGINGKWDSWFKRSDSDFGGNSEIYRKSAISGLIRHTALNYDVK